MKGDWEVGDVMFFFSFSLKLSALNKISTPQIFVVLRVSIKAEHGSR